MRPLRQPRGKLQGEHKSVGEFMTGYCYEAVDASGLRTKGMLEVASQSEALQRIKEMGLFPMRIQPRSGRRAAPAGAQSRTWAQLKFISFGGRVKPAAVSVFTRQLATLVEAGLPLLRGLRLLAQQERKPIFKRIITELGIEIEGGNSLSEALSLHPKVFNRLYVSMVKAGEASGALEITLRRLAEFQEKAQRLKGKIKSAMFYPVSVMFVASAILVVMMVFVVPRFQLVFQDLMGGRPMPTFTVFVLHLSYIARHHALLASVVMVSAGVGFALGLRSVWGRWMFDRVKLRLPVLGNVVRKSAIARFARTLGTLLGSGVPILQSLTILRETAGNVHVARLITSIHDAVKEGETVSLPLRESTIFPPMIVGMVDVGEETGALPDMLLKIADDCDNEVDNAVSAMTSLLEPVMIVFLAVVVGSIVIAMFWPIIIIVETGFDNSTKGVADN